MNLSHEWNRDFLLQSPLFAPLHPVIARLNTHCFPTLDELNTLLDMHPHVIAVQNDSKLRFVAQGAGRLMFEAQYEPRCYLTGEVQTRQNNWHDLLNALVWLTYPAAKTAINTRHYHALTNRDTGRSSERGAVRDTNTLLDESGVIVAYADEELAGLLRSFQWRELFWQQRERVNNSMGFYLFGHGLYEKGLQPYVGMTGQGLLLPVEQDFFSWPQVQQSAHLDTLLTDYLADPENFRTTRELSPVPLLGVPGWSADNNCVSYYENSGYFRSGRRKG